MKSPALRWLAGLAVLVLLPGLAYAEAGTTGAEEAPNPPGIEDLKQAMLELGVDHVQAVEPPAAAGSALLQLFIGPGASGVRVLSASLTIDDQSPTGHDFTPSESAALDRIGLYRLTRQELVPGDHRLRAKLVLRPADAADSVESTTLDLDQAVGLGAGTTEIELQPDRESPLGAAQLKLSSLVRQPFGADQGWFLSRLLASVLGEPSGQRHVVAGSDDDPAVRYARFLAANAQYLDAAVALERLPRQVPGMALAPAYSLARCRVLVQYGLLEHARAAGCLALPEGVGVDNAWDVRLGLAEAYLQRGAYAAADEVLEAPPARREKAVQSRWQDLKSRILIAQGQLGVAADVLQGNSAAADYDSYVRYYNLAVAYVAAGRVDQGLTILDRVGQLHGASPALQALVDRANLALGAYFLRDGQGGTAIPILERIGTTGRYANRAFLDLGWAWLAPEGVVHERTEIGDERTVGVPPESAGKGSGRAYDQNVYQRYDLTPFTRVHASDDREARLKRALAVWSQILDRDPEDEAVQETLLAVAYALDQLDAHEESVKYLEKARVELDLSLRGLGDTVKYVDGSRFVEDLLRDPSQSNRFERGLGHLPPPAEAQYVFETLAGPRFQSLLADYRDLQVMAGQLSRWAPQSFTMEASTDGAGAAAPAQPVPDAPADVADGGSPGPDCRAPCAGILAGRIADLREQVDAAQAVHLARMRQQVTSDLDAQIRWRLHLLEVTRFQLARTYDDSSGGASP
ncbi:MAG: tetratricopeptide repeat protein [Nevskia sp.]|nr:tetratricopeptide repeat protein [Nevskia sp.]